MFEFPKVPGARLTGFRHAANSAVQTLQAAGLPTVVATDPLHPPTGPGVVIAIDPGDDAAGGIWAHWECADAVGERAGHDLLTGRHDSPSIAFHGAVVEAMQKAIIAILTASGFTVRASDDDIQPFAIRVVEVPAEDA